MSKDVSQKDSAKADPQVDKMDTGGHLGGTNFGQAGGDAKTKDTREGGDKRRPNDGSK